MHKSLVCKNSASITKLKKNVHNYCAIYFRLMSIFQRNLGQPAPPPSDFPIPLVM